MSVEPGTTAALRPADGPARAPGWRQLLAAEPARALALFALVLGVFFAPALRPGVAFLYRDNGRMHVPHKRMIAEALSAGHLPEWNPWGGLGYPLIGGAVDGVQHPLNLLLVALPFEVGFKAWTLLSFLLAAMGTFAWARRLGAPFAAAVAGGLAVSLSGYLVSSTDNLTYVSSLGTLPLLLAAAHAYFASGARGRLAALGLASALVAAAGDPQSWGIAVGALPVYAVLLVDAPGASRRVLLWRGAKGVAAALVAAAPLVAPVLAWMPHSSRGDPLLWVELERYNLLPLRAVEFVIPGLLRSERVAGWSKLYEAYAGNAYTPLPWVASEYLGVSVFAFACLAASRARRAAILVGAAILFAWTAMGTHAGFGAIAAHLPVVSGFRYWEKMAFFTALLVALAAALGVATWIRDGGSRRFAWGTAAAAALLLGAGALGQLAPAEALRLVAREGYPAESAEFAANLFAGLGHAGAVCALLALLAAAALRGRLGARGRAVAAAGLVAVDLGAANATAYFVSPTALVRPPSALARALAAEPGLHRVVTPFPLDDHGPPPLRPFEWASLRGAATLQSGWNVEYRVGNFEPFTGMVPARAMRFRLRTGYRHQLPMVGIWGIDHLAVPGRPERAAEMELPPPYDVAVSEPDLDTVLLRIPHRPRAYVAAQVRSVDRRGAMEFVLDAASVRSAQSVVEGEVPAGLAPASGVARIVEDHPERVALEIEASGTALVVLNDTYAPGWRATVDGAPVPISPANYLARGVWTPPGRHRIVFSYRTPGLALGWAIAAAGVLALLAAALHARGRGLPPGAPTGQTGGEVPR